MDIVGLTFDEELKEYVIIEALKVSKWINPRDFSLDVIFRLTIEHKYGKDGFRRVKELRVYFRKEDMENMAVDPEIIEKEKETIRKTELDRSRERELEEKISPLKGYIHPIITERVTIEDDGERKCIKVSLEDYKITHQTRKRNIFFSLKSDRGIVSFDDTKAITEKTSWTYNCMIEPYLVQTLKWDAEEFMPILVSLEIWLQLPKELYSTISAIDIQPVSHLEQMFLLGKEIAKKFRDAGQPLAQEDTLCINWTFSNASISSPPDEIRVIHRPGLPGKEEDFVRQFRKIPEDSILILREILYTCRIRTINFEHIISGVSNRNLKKVLGIFNTMIFQKNLRPMEENLRILLHVLQWFRNFRYYKEFFDRYDIFYALITCKTSEDFFSERKLSKIKQFQEIKDTLDPDNIILIQSLNNLVETTKKFNLYNTEEDKSRYRNEIISLIDKLEHEWWGKLIHPDKYILTDILSNWKHVIEKEYEGHLSRPEIEAEIKTRRLVLTNMTGLVITIRNVGKGEAREVRAKLLQGDDYDVITEVSESKALLISGGGPFEPELIIKPKSKGRITVLYEIYCADTLGKEEKKHFEEVVEFVEKDLSFRKIQNPYIIGDAIRNNRMFFGREKLIRNIVENFKGKYQINPIFLYGQRRTGKTSILYQLKEELRNDFIPIFFTLSEISEEKSFCQDLMEKIVKELKIADIEIPDIKGDVFDGFKNEFYGRIAKKSGKKKLVLMIDEYQQLDQLIAERRYDDSVIDFLNALVQDGEIKFILAGFLQPDELENQKWTELMRFFTTMKVSFLSREDTIRLICEPVTGFLEYDEGGIEKIISLSGCHPYFTQLICHTMVEHHNLDKVSIIGYNSVIGHLFLYFERGYNTFLDIIDQTGNIERKILFCLYSLMAEKKEISVHKSEIEWNLIEYENEISKVEIEKALTHLVKKEIIKKSIEHPDYYEFTTDLYRNWVRWNLTREQLEGENE
jgi:hypothetical protein